MTKYGGMISGTGKISYKVYGDVRPGALRYR